MNLRVKTDAEKIIEDEIGKLVRSLQEKYGVEITDIKIVEEVPKETDPNLFRTSVLYIKQIEVRSIQKVEVRI